jgi:hypothetical protein
MTRVLVPHIDFATATPGRTLRVGYSSSYPGKVQPELAVQRCPTLASRKELELTLHRRI